MRLQAVDGIAIVEGEGFQPGTEVELWMFSNPENLGQALVRPDGTFVAQVSLELMPEGEHTLQVNGVTKDNRARMANIGVVLDVSAVLPVTGTETLPLQFALLACGIGLLSALIGARRRTDC